jgi:signal peptidase I
MLRKRRDDERHGIAEWAVTILLLLFGTTVLCQAYVIPTGSMENNLLIGDHLLVDKLAYAPAGPIAKHLLPYADPKHGDIIVFRYPPDLSQTLVKRLIGAPGDRIRIANGVLYRNGKPVVEPYVNHHPWYEPVRDNWPGDCCLPVKTEKDGSRQLAMLQSNVQDGVIAVPPGNYFAMGDNRDLSYDSRYWGFVPRENIVGKPVVIYWSYKASTEDLIGDTPGAIATHLIDVGEHFFTRTRWDRMGKLIHGTPDSDLPNPAMP